MSNYMRYRMRGAAANVPRYQTKSEEDDHVYIDINIKYDENKDVGQNSSIATYQSTKTEPLIGNPSEYHLTIDRFNLSGFLIPSYIFNPDEPGAVGLNFGGIGYFADLVWTPRTNTGVNDPTYYFIYDYQHYLDILNTALTTAFSLIPAPPAGAVAPYVVWDTDSQKFIVYAQKAFYDLSIATPIKIIFDNTVYRLFPFLPYFEETNNLWSLVMNDYKNNTEDIGGVDYLFLKQQAIGTSYWNPAKGILFTSNSIPVKNTYTQINNQFQDESNATSLGILIDFKLNIDNSLDQRKQLLYVPQQNYRRLDLYGTTPLRTIDIQVYWSDLFGNLYPLRIPKAQEANIKLLFIRKSYIED